MILVSMAVKTVSKAAVNLLSRSRRRNRRCLWASSRSMSRLRASWVKPGSGRMSGDAEDVDAAGGVLDDEERVEPVQGNRVEVEPVAGQDRLGLRSEELRPGRTGASRCGIDAGRAEDSPDGGGADLVAESGEFAVHAPIAPGRIFGGQPDDQAPEACGDGGSAGAGVRGGPVGGGRVVGASAESSRV